MLAVVVEDDVGIAVVLEQTQALVQQLWGMQIKPQVVPPPGATSQAEPDVDTTKDEIEEVEQEDVSMDQDQQVQEVLKRHFGENMGDLALVVVAVELQQCKKAGTRKGSPRPTPESQAGGGQLGSKPSLPT